MMERRGWGSGNDGVGMMERRGWGRGRRGWGRGNDGEKGVGKRE